MTTEVITIQEGSIKLTLIVNYSDIESKVKIETDTDKRELAIVDISNENMSDIANILMKASPVGGLIVLYKLVYTLREIRDRLVKEIHENNRKSRF